MIKRAIVTTLTTLIACTAFSQYDSTWSGVEDSIRDRRQLSFVDARLVQKCDQAWRGQDYIAVAHALFDRMLIRDMRTEDSLYFRNSGFIDSLLALPTTAESLKSLLHLMQAERLAAFERGSHRFNRARYETPAQSVNYAAYDRRALDSVTNFHFQQAREGASALDESDAEDLLWLAADPLSFLYKPRWLDIILADQVGYNTDQNKIGQEWAISARAWMRLSPDAFVATLDSTADHVGHNNPVTLFRNWLRSRKRDPNAWYFIETLARKSFFDRFSQDTAMDGEYEKYLLARTKDGLPEVKAYAVYQLCLAWNKKALDNEGWNGGNWGEPELSDFTSSHSKYIPSMALELYDENRVLFARFASLGQILETMKAQILVPQIRCSMEQTNLPNQPLLARISYKNAPKLYYRIVHLDQAEALAGQTDGQIVYLLSKPALRQEEVALPSATDHTLHHSFLKIDPLPPGKYCLVFSDTLAHPGHEVNAIPFTVTGLAILHTDRRVYILDNKTGKPLAGADIVAKTMNSMRPGRNKAIIGRYQTNGAGFADLKQSASLQLEVAYKGDTLTQSVFTRAQDLDDALGKGYSNGAKDFYLDNAMLFIYTDRGIYRPGQTLHFKGILMTRDAGTGAPIIFNRQNTTNGWGATGLQRWIREEKPVLYIKDPFDRELDSMNIQPDEYGSFSGSFTIPRTVTTGEWNFETDFIDVDRSSRMFKVEEYKRPTFELTTLPPARTWLPGQPIEFVVKVRSFAGTSLSSTSIHYSIQKDGNDLVDTAQTVGIDGLLHITLLDTAAENHPMPDSVRWDIRYTLEATATDLTGESHEVERSVNVSSRPVNIRLPAEATYLADEIPPLFLSAKDPNGLPLSRTLQVQIFRQRTSNSLYEAEYTYFADRWLYPISDLRAWFPTVQFIDSSRDVSPQLVYSATVNTTSGEKIRIPSGLLSFGNYQIVVESREGHTLRGRQTADWTILAPDKREWPIAGKSLLHLPVTSVKAGDSLRVYMGTPFDSTTVLVNINFYAIRDKKLQALSFFTQKILSRGVRQWQWMIPKDATDQLEITTLFVRNNTIYRHAEKALINNLRAQPVIRIEEYRDQLAPGETTRFSVSVRTKNKSIAAELMSGIYDAALDKLQPHQWTIPAFPSRRRDLGNDWPYSIKRTVTESVFGTFPTELKINSRKPVWWLSDAAGRQYGIPGAATSVMNRTYYDNPLSALEGRVPGLYISQANGLDEVITKGYYGTTTMRLNTGDVVTIRGEKTLPAMDKGALVILDGVPYTGDVNKIDLKNITNGVLLQGADATAIYGTRAAHGVLILSTKGEINLPPRPEPPAMRIRSNFNETAFFSPAIRADKDGLFTFTCTMPESVTEWNWQLFAHTRMAEFAYAERKLTTRLPLMVQPNLPRLLYQGDRIVVKSRIGNLDSTKINGQAYCSLEDAITGQDLTASLVDRPKAAFSVAGQGDSSVAFVLTIPKGLLHPIKITVKAVTSEYSDAEAHTIPVLSTRILVRRPLAFRIAASKDTLCHLPLLDGDDSLLGVGLSINTPPQASLVNALPWLANYSFDCAEQTFNKMLARLTALELMRTDNELRRQYTAAGKDTARPSQAGGMPDDPAILAMPWLDLSRQTARQHQQLLQLLDTLPAQTAIEAHLTRLYGLQNSDGGLSWFGGGESNQYISAYVLAGFGALRAHTWRFPSVTVDKLEPFLTRLLQFLDERTFQYPDLFTVYARHFWQDQYPVRAGLQASIRKYLISRWREIDRQNLSQQALLIINSMAYFDPADSIYQKAQEQLDNLRQSAITDADNGTRWKDLADADDLNTATEETVGLLAEAFHETSYYPELRLGLIKWLLQANTDHHWQSTKATAAAIELLRQVEGALVAPPQNLNVRIGDSAFDLSNNLIHGQSSVFMPTMATATDIHLHQPGFSPVAGNIVVYYFTSGERLNRVNQSVQLRKILYLYDNSRHDWVPLTESTIVHIADRIKIVLTLESAKPLRYVYIEDKRAAAFEPIEVQSGYTAENGFPLYHSIRDMGDQFFAEFIPSGRWNISYEVKAAYEGTFTNGPAVLQCMYKPEIAAYSNSSVVVIF